MASLDDDLLALAGDSSDEEGVSSPQPKATSASPRPSSSASPDTKKSPHQSTDMARKGVAKAVKSAKLARRSRKPKKDESDDEGEL
jgi:RNA polymerase-associated protein RTF1